MAESTATPIRHWHAAHLGETLHRVSSVDELPVGTVTFLFTDIEGSTLLERELRERYSEVLAEHRRLLREAFEQYGGREVDTQGDSFFVVFPRARDAVAAAVAAQRALIEHTWLDGRQLRVRIGMHTGEASLDDGRYVGLAVHRGARISAAGHGGQILLSNSTRDVVEDDLPAGQRLVDLGENRLKDLPRPERIFQLCADGLRTEFPPLKTDDEQELAEAAQALPALPWWRRGRSLVALAGVAVVVAIAVLALVFTLGPSDAGATVISANAVGLIDASGNSIDAEIPVDAAPTSVARGEGAVWVTNAADGTVSRIDPGTRSVRDTITVGSSPSGIAVGAAAVWVANHFDATVSRIDPETNTVVGDPIAVGNDPTAVAFGEGSVWVTNSADRTVSRIDPASGRVVRTITTDAVGRGIAVGGGSVWVTDESSRRVLRVDPETNAVAETISVGNGPTGIAFGERGVWVANSLDGTVSRIDPKSATVTAIVTVPGGPGAVAVGQGAVWVSAEFGQRLARIDPDVADPKVVGDVAIGNRPKGLVAAADGVWVAVQESGQGHRGGRLIALQVGGTGGSIDPQLTDSFFSGPHGSVVYGGLTGFRRAGGGEGTQLVPNLATSMPDARDGGRSYTFRLRPGVRYSDGRRVRPEDFRRGLERAYEVGGWIVDEGSTALTAVLGGDLCSKGRRCDLSKGIVTTGDTLTFRLSKPTPFFLSHLSYLYPIPAGTPSRDIGTKPVPGTGPYAIESFVPGRQTTLVRNPHFRVWSETATPNGYPDEIVMRAGDPGKALKAVERGEADLLQQFILRPDQIERLRVRHPGQLHVEPERSVVFLHLDTTQPPFTDVRVRQAVNYAIDRRRLVELGGGATFRQSTCQVIPPNIPGYIRHCPYTLDPQPTGEWTAPDLAKAQQLIAASGTRGQKVTVWTWSEFGKEGRYLARLLRRLGYRTQLEERKDFGTYAGAVFDPKPRPQSSIMGWFGMQYGSDAIGVFSCGNPSNLSRFCDRGTDRKAARAQNRFATDPDGAARSWAQLDRELVDEAPVVPLFNLRSSWFVSKRVGNWQYHPYNGILLDQLWVK